MRAECVEAVTRAAASLGRKLTDTDLRGIEDRIREQTRVLGQKDPNFPTLPADQRLKLAGEAAAQALIHEKIKARQRADLNISTRDSLYKTVTAMVGRGMSHGKALDYLTSWTQDGKAGVISLEKSVDVVAHDMIRQLEQLTNLYHDNSFMGLMYSQEGQIALRKAMWGEPSGNPKADAAAAQIKKVLDNALERFNRKGGDVGKNENWHTPQNLDSMRAQALGREGFVDKWMTLVDRAKMVTSKGTQMTDDELRRFLNEVYTTLDTDGVARVAAGNVIPSNVASRNKAHRQIHYKSSEAWQEAMNLAGTGDLFAQLDSHIRSLARDIAIVEHWGPNAVENFKNLKSWASQNDSATGKFDAQLMNDIEYRFNEVAGLDQSRYTMKQRRAINELKAFGVATRLGSMIAAQIGDLTSTLTTARAMQIPITQLASIAAKMAVSPAYMSYARSMGYALESMAHSLTRYGEANVSNGWMSKSASAVVNLQGANHWNRWLRGAFGVAFASHISDMNTRYKDFNSLGAWDKFVMESKGVNERDWKLWQMVRDGDGNITPNGINQIPLDQIHQFIPEKIAEIQQRGAELMQRVDAQNIKEFGWLQGREKKFADYKAKLEKLISDMEDVRSKRAEDFSEKNLAQAGTLQARLEQAEIEFEIFNKRLQGTAADRSDRFMEQVKRGMEWYGQRRSEIGERLGAARHSAKLAASRVDSSIERIGQEISDKFNKLYGPEATDKDGFKIVGKVVEAAKEYEAYAQKMEKRIANSYRKDGSLKQGKDGTVERAERLKENARIEFEAIKQKADQAIEELRSKSEGKIAELEALSKLIEQKKLRAETEADIAAYLQTEKSFDKIQGFLDTLEFRGNHGAERLATEGERLGYRRAMVESRLREMNRREAQYGKTAQKEVFGKAAEFEKRIDARMRDLDEFRKSIDERMAERQKLVDEYNKSIGRKIDEAALDFRQQAIDKFIGMTLEETHMAVMERSSTSKFMRLQLGKTSFDLGKDELMGMFMQFKGFGWAFYEQHLKQRSQFYANAAKATGQSPGFHQLAYFGMIAGLATVFGGASLLATDVVKGNDPREAFSEERYQKFMMNAFLRGGGVGWINDVVESLSNPDAPQKHMGVIPQLGSDILSIGGQAIKATTGDEKESRKAKKELAKEVYNTAIQSIPGQNLWMIRAPLHNYFLHDLHELANPGYWERSQKNMEKRTGTQSWATPSGFRAPEFGNIVGQGATQ